MARILPFTVRELQNRDGEVNTIRVDSKVVSETDSDAAKDDETRWMRLTLDTVGKLGWPPDRQGRPIYPDGFEEIAQKLGRPNYPPGRDVRGIVSVGMLTEGWDCRTVTHIVGLRPFMSQESFSFRRSSSAMLFITMNGTREATRSLTVSFAPLGSVPSSVASIGESKAKSAPRAFRTRMSRTFCVR